MGVLNCLKRFFKAVVPHIIVLAMLFGYLIFGAAVFTYLETGSSDLEMYMADLGKLRDFFTGGGGGGTGGGGVDDSPGATVAGYGADYGAAPTGPDPTTPAPVDMAEMMDELMDKSLRPEWKVGRMQAVQSKRAWSFASSMLFCLTTITTIGYGDVVPVTSSGKVFCVIYSIFGIPLVMLYLAGVGTFLAHLILTLCKILNLGQPIKKAMCTCGVCRRGSQNGGSYEDVSMGSKAGEPGGGGGGGGGDAAEKGAAPGPDPGPGPEETPIVTRQHGAESGSVEDELEAPVLMVVGIMAGYMCAGAFMMSGIEDWTFGEGLYFTFITLTTIGFGDYVPVMLYREDAFFVCMVYALFGLAVMSMCIALLQAKVRRCGSRVWRCIGC